MQSDSSVAGLRSHPQESQNHSWIQRCHVVVGCHLCAVQHGDISWPGRDLDVEPVLLDYFRRILFEGEAVIMHNPTKTGDSLVQTRDRIRTITPGVAGGRMVGGNLSILASMVGSQFLPDWKNVVLFLEDDGEKIYRVDRMLTQLKLAGILGRVSGVVFGKCTNCEPGEGYGSLTLDEVLDDHVRPLGIPAWSGSMIGHIEEKFTVPLGVRAEINAEGGTIQLLEAAVS